ncbi:rRNA-binding ribosome biosynthesis protein utp25 [Mucor velutinosus]|uniref:rRNA-binding ribosome biosynthesis protein utp25 n=1 Tax=Mucor velutinosus TaxID=708070 RepID=A0AAN7DDQ2_9FUNG|nr:rRNA-binding ribosome biosynthesis protein utp25 [Mucor velutinosus]
MTDYNNEKSLRITNLDPRVTEDALKGIFSLISPIVHIKITKDNSNDGLNCGFVEFHEHQAAEQALHAMDKRTIYSQEIAVNWNDQAASNENQVFVTDLDHNIDDSGLWNAFEKFHVCNARVINPGEGVVTFENKADAEDAIRYMDDTLVGSSRVHCHWHLSSSASASDNSDSNSVSSAHSRRSSTDSDNNVILSNMSYEEIFAQTPLYNTSVSIRGLPKNVISQDIAPHLQQYGFVTDIHIKKGEAIVKLDTHANAATAIFALQGVTIAGKPVRLGWVKDRDIQRIDSQDNMTRSFNVFSSGYVPPSKLVNRITNTYENHTTMRPPAPTTDPAGGEPGGGHHGWNQYYQQHYSAGHLTI